MAVELSQMYETISLKRMVEYVLTSVTLEVHGLVGPQAKTVHVSTLPEVVRLSHTQVCVNDSVPLCL